MPDSHGNLIIIGASARAAAQSAIRAGYAPWCIDLFADRDLRAIAPVKRCPRDKWPGGILELMGDAPPGPVLLTGAMENHLEVVDAIAVSRPLLGSSPDAIRRARDPMLWRKLPTIKGTPPLKGVKVDHFDISFTDRGKKLVKPTRSAGGLGIRMWNGHSLREDEYLQRYIPGAWSGGAVCFADHERASVLYVCAHTAHATSGANRFLYRGGMFPALHPWRASPARAMAVPVTHRSALAALVSWIAAECGLRGLFGVDYLVAQNWIWPLEVNPRYPANAELAERVLKTRALLGQASDEFPGRFAGKRIVYTRKRLCVPDLYRWFDRDEIADVPAAEEVIEPGQPVATVFADAASHSTCKRRLYDAARKLYTRLRSSWIR